MSELEKKLQTYDLRREVELAIEDLERQHKQTKERFSLGIKKLTAAKDSLSFSIDEDEFQFDLGPDELIAPNIMRLIREPLFANIPQK